MKDLSVIIVSYNTKDITKQCLDSLAVSLRKVNDAAPIQVEVIVVDNGSQDGSDLMLKDYRFAEKYVTYTPLLLHENTGFSKGNNVGLAHAHGNYLLYLNSDVLIDNVDFKALIKYMDQDSQIGALTVRVNLGTGSIDPASHRGFPTLWRSFTYYSGLERLLGKISGLGILFGGYHLTHLNLDTVHQIDSGTAAFYIMRTELARELHGFDEQFFMYGEDLDFSYRIKQHGLKILYYPTYRVTHLKHKSGLSSVSDATANRTRDYFYQSMKLFYSKHYAAHHSWVMNKLTFLLIDLKKALS